MAYIVGILTEEEEAELKRRGDAPEPYVIPHEIDFAILGFLVF
jgi:hypothetical protein